jgi:hypothetical protein
MRPTSLGKISRCGDELAHCWQPRAVRSLFIEKVFLALGYRFEQNGYWIELPRQGF